MIQSCILMNVWKLEKLQAIASICGSLLCCLLEHSFVLNEEQ